MRTRLFVYPVNNKPTKTFLPPTEHAPYSWTSSSEKTTCGSGTAAGGEEDQQESLVPLSLLGTMPCQEHNSCTELAFQCQLQYLPGGVRGQVGSQRVAVDHRCAPLRSGAPDCYYTHASLQWKP